MIRFLLISFLFFSCSEKRESPQTPPSKKRRTVKVAAIQCYSQMGKKKENRELLSALIKQAAGKGSKIIVLPEAAVSGYMDPQGMRGEERIWTKEAPDKYSLAVQEVAEKVPGISSKYFSALAVELKIYLTIPLIEEFEGNFYNSVLLADPNGKLVGHHRKKEMWTHGDGAWCSKGSLPPQVADSEYGKLGLMICYDHHVMLPLLKEKGATIILNSVGWNGPAENWFKVNFPDKIKKFNMSAVVANWSHGLNDPHFEGAGLSNVLYKNGIIIKQTDKKAGSTIVIADLPY